MFLFCFLLKFIENHKILDPRNAPEKNFETQEIPTRKKIGTHQRKFETHEISKRKYFGPTKYPREIYSVPRRHDGTMSRDPRDPTWHVIH